MSFVHEDFTMGGFMFQNIESIGELEGAHHAVSRFSNIQGTFPPNLCRFHSLFNLHTCWPPHSMFLN
jgi:hypothetical protein